jgi:SAM-dependent methyltransferase
MKLLPSWKPLGLALIDYHIGQRAAFITVRSSVEPDREVPVDAFYREALRFSRLEKTALKNCRGKVLDIGAGSGAHCLWLQKKGLDVTALDISPDAAEVMRLRGLKKAFAADFRDFKTGERFDTLLLMMNGIGVCQNLPGLEAFLKKCKTMLAAGGQIIFDSTDIAYVPVDNRALAGLHLPAPEYHGTVWYQLIYKGQLSEPYEWIFIDKETMRTVAAKQGFRMEILAEAGEQYLARLMVK